MGTILVASIAAAITLSTAGAALGQPQPDPAPVPAPAPAPAPTPATPPAPAPSVTPPPATASESEPRPARTKKKPVRAARRKREVVLDASPPTHPPRAEVAAAIARTPAATGRDLAAAPPIPSASGSQALPTGVATGLLILCAGALLALIFAVIPRRALASLSVELVEHRSDIGLAMALAIALGGAVLVFVVAA